MNLYEWYYNKLEQIEELEEKVLQYEFENKVLKQQIKIMRDDSLAKRAYVHLFIEKYKTIESHDVNKYYPYREV